MTLSVHMLCEPDPDAHTHLRERLAPAVNLTVGLVLPEPAVFHILVMGRPGQEHITASPNLRALVIPWAGLPKSTHELMRQFPHIAVHNLHHNARPVAEMAVALMLSAAKLLLPADSALRSHDWRPRYNPARPLLLAGKTALVLGYGAVGREVAQLCRALGMEVLAMRRSAGVSRDGEVELHPAGELHQLLPRADALLICLPHTSDTDGLIGPAELALLSPHAVLVNIGRGAIVDQEALYAALRDREILAAGLDVWYNYPTNEESRANTPPADWPFHELGNVVMSPHRAGLTDRTEQLRMEHLAALLNAAARGDEMPNRVNLEAGY